MNQTDWKEIFAPNDGMLLNIIAFDTKLNDWRHLFGLLSALYTFTYSEDDAEKELPDIELIFHRRQEASTCLRINAAGISINCHFFGEEPMDFDVLPEEVDSPEKAKAVFDFMTKLAIALSREVFLFPEFGSGERDTLLPMTICSADAGTGKIKFLENSPARP